MTVRENLLLGAYMGTAQAEATRQQDWTRARRRGPAGG